jgi:colanic acid/amylovoran biosynthesis protein
MNILIVNQPTGNRGDEAAHRGLVRALSKRYPDATIRIVFMGVPQPGFEGLQVKAANVVYENIPIRHIQKLAKWAFMFHFRWLLTHLRSGYRLLRKRIRDADWVVSAPSGICLGPFRSWYMLLVDWMVLREKKPFAYYSPSFGPKPEGQKGDNLFWSECVNVLKRMDFLSIRDAKTMKFADDLGLRYVPSIDTAFLDSPVEVLSQELGQKVGDRYVVFVPNSLTWHVAYRNTSQEVIDGFYFQVMDLLSDRFPDARIVLLPQLYGQGNGGDHAYFLRLRERYSHPERIVILPDTLNSDIQQAVVAKARFVVGARYHSIVFAINNAVPFCALSYEHKMQGLLKSLGAEDCMLDIQHLGKELDSTPTLLPKFDLLLETGNSNPSRLQAAASRIAMNCFDSFSKKLDGQ